MKKILPIVIIILLGIAGWYYRFPLQKLFKQLPQVGSALVNSDVVNNIKQEIFAPPPLRGDLSAQSSVLTQAGVIKWTNIQRNENGNLAALAENTKLDEAAQLKVKDMFAKQYFEHISPSGVGPGDLANQVHYEFISEGENLALGNFKDDQALVQAWMDSPGHRANILNTKYLEIGVAVGKGMYEGHETWLAVQEFGKPASACPTVDASLKLEISQKQAELKTQEAQLLQMRSNLEQQNPQTREEYAAYNQQLAIYNQSVQDHNTKLQVLKELITQYNAEVNAYNACLGQ